MYFRYLDYLSPPITFYHEGYLTHSSFISIILSILSFIIIISLSVYFSLDIILRENPTAFYFNRYIEDAGIYPLNASSFFHFLSIAQNTTDNTDKGIDFRAYRIIGFDDYYNSYLENKDLSKYNHWLYGICNNETDTEGISHLIKYEFFKNSACIRKYFSSENQKYYDTNDPNFKWPILAHGTYNPKAKFYTIILERCKQNTLNFILGPEYKCRNDSEMDTLFSNIGATHLFYIDHYIDILNYQSPNTKYIYSIENGLHKTDYSVNHLNINPSTIKTHNGLIFENIKEEHTYVLDRNDVFTYPNENTELYMVYYFWLKNRMNHYERNYKRIQDVTSSIGGIYQIVTVIAIFANRLFNKYIVLSDTEKLLFSSIYTEKYTSKSKIKTHDDKKKYKDLEKSKHKNKNSDKGNPNNTAEKSKDTIGQYKIDSNISRNIIHTNEGKEKTDKSQDFLNKIINEENQKCNNYQRKTRKLNFFEFILFKLSCDTKNCSFKVYKKFRTKIISEEHLIRNHLNIYNLLRLTEKKRNFKRYSYRLQDLIKLV